ncbi:MAG TPA: GIY-YIG nuclease family protein, partial [Methylomirabilota bacterium]|nr:GIY-YIG nuclease family protein [Methylomirabilota bacterium]
MSERSDLDILADLGLEPVRKAKTANTPREARIIAGFEDIQKFVEEHGRPPQHGEDRNIFERIYAVRLDRLRDQADCVALLRDLDHQGLLSSSAAETQPAPSEMDDDALLTALGVTPQGGRGITELKHVRSLTERRAAEDVAVRQPCEDFAAFEPIFAAVK